MNSLSFTVYCELASSTKLESTHIGYSIGIREPMVLLKRVCIKQVLLALLFVVFAMLSYGQTPVTFVITNVPSYTPVSDTLYLVSSLDNWTLANADKKFKLFPDGNYRLTIDVGNTRKFEYKINRGDWDKVEGNPWGDYISNRRFTYHDSIFEVRLKVESWQDLHDIEYPPIEVIVISVPENTPPDASIFMAGTFNNWMDNDPAYKLTRRNDGTFHGEIQAGIDSVQFKFTRGSWESIEGRWDGGMRSNRQYISHQAYNNQMVAEIKSWNDLSNKTMGLKVIFLVLLVQCIIIISLLVRFSRSGHITVLSILLALAFFAKFFYGHHQLLYNFPYGYFLPIIIYPFIGVSLYTWFYSAINKTSVRFKIMHLLPLLPVIWLVYILLFSGNAYLAIVNNQFAGFIFSTYTYGIVLHIVLNYKLKKYIARQIAEIPDLTYRFYQAVQTNLYFSAFILSISGILAWQKVDIKFVIDWLDHILWIGIGIVVVYYEWFFFSNLYSEFIKNKIRNPKHLPEQDSWAHLKEKLTVLMIEKHVYTNPNLTLSDLAGHLGTNNHYVSKLINEGFKKSYTDYVNAFRIEAFIKAAKSDKENNTYLSIAYKVGFNSKSAFNRAFKKVTNTTPSEYFSDSLEKN